MQVTKQQHERGFTLAELMFASMVFAILASVMLNHLSINYATTASERDRVFAYSKAQSILSEIQAYVDRGQAAAAVDLDVLDDGTVNNPLLTISTRVNGSSLKPDDELSGNFSNGNDWTWSRRVTVRPFQGLNNRNVRYVTVHIYKRNLENVERPVAELSAVINSTGSGYPTTQVFDIYLLAVENIPGWWVYMDSIRPFVESAITDLETRNPGLEVRTHWITKSSFGRNQSYRPYVNDVADSRQQIPFVYFYPARMPAGQSSAYY
ncbi:MAG: prepilin-type N-terminal cleavage/methylation domain-containing protein, partial [Planctomycetota bacterium]